MDWTSIHDTVRTSDNEPAKLVAEYTIVKHYVRTYLPARPITQSILSHKTFYTIQYTPRVEIEFETGKTDQGPPRTLPETTRLHGKLEIEY